MSKKTFPLSKDELEEIINKYPTPFHIYDEHAIRENIRKLQKAFAWAPRFREQFAVKALPNPRILQVLHEEALARTTAASPSSCSRTSRATRVRRFC